MMLTGNIEAEATTPASGKLTGVKCGRYMGRLVAVKYLRVAGQDDSRDMEKVRKVGTNDTLRHLGRGPNYSAQQLRTGIVQWSTLSHPNILNLVGVQEGMEEGQFVTVSEWMTHGNIMEYTKHNPVNRLELVREFTFPAAPFTKTWG